ncbi:MAG: polysaccharide deacetylase family protein [candidate division Zixibacteria bacterium]|nr:polysaccharide deacetylase family protein [candidate division Zixibacteria bacterium]
MNQARLMLKQLLAASLYYTGLLALWIFLKQTIHGSGTIIAYHCFLDEDDPLRGVLQSGLCVTSGNFEHQVLFFKRHCRLISLNDMIDALAAGRRLPRRAVVITVDDGWRDNYVHCFPVLVKHGAQATIFLTVDVIEGNSEFWFLRAGRILGEGHLKAGDLAGVMAGVSGVSQDVLQADFSDSQGNVDRDRFMEHLKRLDHDRQKSALDALERLSGVTVSGKRFTLNWDEIRQMSEAGVDFGSHGCSHRILTHLSPDEAAEELSRSRARLTEQLGKEIRHFAYPNGDFNDTVAELISSAGYDCGLATSYGTRLGGPGTNRFALRRIGMHDGVTAGVSGRFSNAMLAFHLARFG